MLTGKETPTRSDRRRRPQKIFPSEDANHYTNFQNGEVLRPKGRKEKLG
jgi:hypothetical protein